MGNITNDSSDNLLKNLKPQALDKGLLIVLAAFMGFGLVQVYSSSFIFATESRGDGLFFFRKQLFFSILAFTAMIGVAQIPVRILQKWGFMLWIFASLLLALTFVPGIGVKAGGATRWIQFGSLRFEPSELLKVSLAFLIASIISYRFNFLKTWKWPVVTAVLLLPLVALLKQPDFGSFAICSVVIFSVLFFYGLKWRYVLVSTMAIVPIFYYLVMMVPYRRARLMTFLDPWSVAETGGFQVIQSMLSLHAGGITGVGLGQGQGKLFFLPEAHTDFTLAVLGEELGFIGLVLLLFVYLFLIFKGFQTAARAPNKFTQSLALAITMGFALQVFVNVGVVLGLVPTKGLTLPFLSYGGSSLLVTGIAFGVLLNIRRYLLTSR